MKTIHDKLSIRKDLRESLPFRLGFMSRIIFKKMNVALNNEGIPVLATQMPILMVVYFQEDAMTQQDISKFMQKDKAGIQRAVQSLAKDGFLRIKSDESDKRKNLISLTASGRYVCEKVQKLAVEFHNQIMGKLSEDERTSFHTLMNKIESIVTE